MAYEDSDPDRRNLAITSLAFIAFYCAGGSVDDKQLQLVVINITFQRPFVLAIMAWGILFWFGYRYWVTHRGVIVRALNDDITPWAERHYVSRYVVTLLPPVSELRPELDPEKDGAWFPRKLYWEGRLLKGYYMYSQNISIGANNRLRTGTINEKYTYPVEFSRIWGRWITFRILAEWSVSKPTFSGFVFPYLLFGIAILSALISRFLPI